MNKLLFMASLLIAIPLFSQISVETKPHPEFIGAFKYLGSTYVECRKTINENKDDYYSFVYRNSKYKQIEDLQSFGFYDIDNAFENFYTLCLEGFVNMPDDNYILLSLEDGDLMVRYTKSAGVVSMYFIYTENGVTSETFFMNQKQAQKLFGKFKKKKKK